MNEFEKICPIMRLKPNSEGDYSCMGRECFWWDETHRCCGVLRKRGDEP